MKGVTETQLAYIAGLIDGEGTFLVGRYPKKGIKGLAYRGFMSIANTHVPTLQYVKSIMGGRIIEQGVGKKTYGLAFSPNVIRMWVPLLLPYLMIKKDQAEILLEFLEKQASNFSAPVTSSLREFYESCYTKLKDLKMVRFDFKEVPHIVDSRKCGQCGKEFHLMSNQSKLKVYCSSYCKKKTHWTRSNERISAGIPAWNFLGRSLTRKE